MRSALTPQVKAGLLEIDFYHWRLRQNRFPGVAVLAYHGVRSDAAAPGQQPFEGLHVTEKELDSHCRLLKDTCRPISLAEWRSTRNRKAGLPARPVLITFDDGYRSIWKYALPILRNYGIPAVMFICSGPVEQRRLFWFDAVARARGEAEVEDMKRLPFEDWRLLCSQPSQFREDDPAAPLSIEEVIKLSREPGLEIGSHTASHAILARASKAIQFQEIVEDKARLEAWINKPVTSFAYPNGQPHQDYTQETVNLVKEADFEMAFTTQAGFANRDQTPLEHSRFLMSSGVSEAELAHRLCFSWRR